MSDNMTVAETLLDVRDLRVAFVGARKGAEHFAVNGVSFSLQKGKCLALVGESGSGKSMSVRSLLGLAGPDAHVEASHMQLQGAEGALDLRQLANRQWRNVRGKRIGFVLQDALSSLDPLRTVGREIAEPLLVHNVVKPAQSGEKVQALLAAVGVPQPHLRAAQYPHQLSGGLRQRALIATAIAAEPDILIADEPTTALDATVQQQILQLLLELKRRGTALLLVSHDLSVVAQLADEVAVMKAGKICEIGNAEQVINRPQHPYTRMLLAAIPSGRTRGQRLSVTEVPAVAQKILPLQPVSRETNDIVLQARDLSRAFAGPQGSSRQAVDDVSLILRRGETLGLVGESGSGKTTLARLILGLEQPDSGRVELCGTHWSPGREKLRRNRRHLIQAVWQDPLGSFDPRYRVGALLGEALELAGLPTGQRRDKSAELLAQVGLRATFLEHYPTQLSGGQRQRVAIARALAYQPQILVCDEPVSALDVSIQAQVLDLLQDLKAALGLSVLFISHDLGVIQHISDRVLVMKDGCIVEQGDVQSLFDQPHHVYTRQLLAAVPRLGTAA